MPATNHNAKEEPLWQSVSIFFVIFLISYGVLNIHLSLFLLLIPVAVSFLIAFTATYIQKETDLVTIFDGGPVSEQSTFDYFIGWGVLSLVSILAIHGVVFPGEGVDPLIAVAIYVAVLILFVLDKYTRLLSPVLSQIPETRSLGLYYSLLLFPVFVLDTGINTVLEGTASQIASTILLFLVVAMILVDAIRAR